MKVYLIKASAPGDFKDYKKMTGGPSQNIHSAAACTPAWIDIEMTDETIDMKVNFKSDADIVAIFFSTPDAVHGYKVASEFKKLWKTVVMWGLHASFMTLEALKYADSVMIWEIEWIWEELIEDFSKWELKKLYQRKTPVDLATLKPYPTHIIPLSKYNRTWSVVVWRGCKYACAYCTVTPFFKKLRFRPIDNIVEEVKNCWAKYVELHADNLIADREYALELLRKLAPLKKTFFGEATVDIAEDKEMLEAMKAAGFKYILVGLETPDQEALNKVWKWFLKVEKLEKYIKIIKSYWIEIDASILFGFDEHDKTIFDRSIKFAKKIKVQWYRWVVVTPYPGTRLYAQWDKEGRIITKDWSKYDGTQVPYKPKQMTTQELKDGVYKFNAATYFWKSIF